MELRVLKYYLAAAQEENISRAAELFHVTQPALSRQMADLIGKQLSDVSNVLLLKAAFMSCHYRFKCSITE